MYNEGVASMYVESIKTKKNEKIYTTHLIRETYRENGKIKHKTIANISHLPIEIILKLKQMLKNKDKNYNVDNIYDGSSYEYGASYAFLSLAKELNLDKMISSKMTQHTSNILTMIIGRILYQGSKLSLVNLYKDSAMWYLAGHELGQRPNVDKDCYAAMDFLLTRKSKIESTLAKKHLTNGNLVLYDITNIWMEGDYIDSEIAEYGKSKDGKKGFKIISIGLLTNESGCPVGVEIFKGNTSDQTTVLGQVKKLSKKYGIKNLIFVGDRGMLTQKRIEEVNQEGFNTLTALTHLQIKKLIDQKSFCISDFKHTEIAEVFNPENNSIRYILCKDEQVARNESQTRQALIDKVVSKLEEKEKIKKKRDSNRVSASIGKIFEQYRIEKFFNWSVDKEGHVEWSVKQDVIGKEKALDGCYVIRTDVPQERINTDQVLLGYRSLQHVEQSFKSMKTILLELRPVYHKTDDRLKSHIFIVMLAYYLKWHAMLRIKPLFDKDKAGSSKRWDFYHVVERLKSIRLTEKMYKENVAYTSISRPDGEQSEILKLLGVNLM